jgi:hypothetical protein
MDRGRGAANSYDDFGGTSLIYVSLMYWEIFERKKVGFNFNELTNYRKLEG